MLYYGVTEGTFKQLYANHLTSFRHDRHSSATELSKFIWDLKGKGTDYSVTRAIFRRAPAYSSASKDANCALRRSFASPPRRRKNLAEQTAGDSVNVPASQKFLLSSHAST